MNAENSEMDDNMHQIRGKKALKTMKMLINECNDCTLSPKKLICTFFFKQRSQVLCDDWAACEMVSSYLYKGLGITQMLIPQYYDN